MSTDVSAGDRVALSLVSYLRAHRRRGWVLLGWSAVAAVPIALSGRIVATAVDAVASGNGARAAEVGGVLAVAAVVGWLAQRCAAVASADLTEAVHQDLTTDVVAGALAFSVETDHPGHGGAELTTHVPVIRERLALATFKLSSLIGAFTAALGFVTVIPVAAAVIVPFVLAAVAVNVALLRRISQRQQAEMRASEDVQDNLSQALDGVRDITAAGATREVSEDLLRRIETARLASVAAGDLTSRTYALVESIGVRLPAVLLLACLPVALDRGASVGDVVGALTYLFAGIGGSLLLAADMARNVIDVEVRLGRLREKQRPVPTVPGSVEATLPGPTTAAVELRGVTFAHGTHAEPIVDRLTLTLAPGEHLAVVGPSGIGKSTLAALLAGILQPRCGLITIDGQPIGDHPRPQTLVTYIPQEAYLFAGTLRDNITYLAADSTDDHIRDAAEAVGLRRVVHRLGGFGADVDPGRSGLSEGEKQLVVLTRAYLSSAPVVILDEATCFLDPVAEDRAERAFSSTQRTLIVIAHRMSATLRASRVLVMDGQRAQLGTHDELLLTNDLYADLHGHWRADT